MQKPPKQTYSPFASAGLLESIDSRGSSNHPNISLVSLSLSLSLALSLSRAILLPSQVSKLAIDENQLTITLVEPCGLKIYFLQYTYIITLCYVFRLTCLTTN